MSGARLLLVALLALGTLVAAGCGQGESEILAARALAALRDGRLDDAEEAARRGATPGFDDFVRGNVAFARSEGLEPDASKPGAPPALFERMVADAEDALAHWRLAAASRADWPAARRNVERALLRLERLRERKRESERRNRPDPPPPPPEPAPDETEPPPPEARPELEEAALPEEAVRALLDLLVKKEEQKRELRRERRAAAGAEVERDW